jgi:hypothetical protein
MGAAGFKGAGLQAQGDFCVELFGEGAPSLMKVLRQLLFVDRQPQSVLELFVRWVFEP